MIPKLVHYVWVGSKPMPPEDQQYVDDWKRLLPGWEFRFWNNDNVDFSSSYLRQAFSVRAWNRVSDYTRMDALARFGGVYLDTDVELVKSLDPLLDQPAFVGQQCGDEKPGELVNGAVFGAQPGHWLPTAIRDHFNEKMDGRDNVRAFSGPGLLTQMLREQGLGAYRDEVYQVRDVSIYPRRAFYPYSWLEEYSPDVVTPETFAVHRWAGTWSKKPDFRTKLRRRAIDMLAKHAPDLALTMSKNFVRNSGRQVEV